MQHFSCNFYFLFVVIKSQNLNTRPGVDQRRVSLKEVPIGGLDKQTINISNLC